MTARVFTVVSSSSFRVFEGWAEPIGEVGPGVGGGAASEAAKKGKGGRGGGGGGVTTGGETPSQTVERVEAFVCRLCEVR